MLKLLNFAVLVKDLATLHNQHLNRPTLDDNADEEQAIKRTNTGNNQCEYFLFFFAPTTSQSNLTHI